MDDRRPEPRGAPALIVVVELEARPQLIINATTAEDAARLRENLLQRPLAEEISELVERAIPELRSSTGGAA
jgi:hypothetical protein